MRQSSSWRKIFFSSCRECGTKKKFRVPMRNRTSDHRIYMADETSYHSYFPATAARFVKKTVPHQNVFKLTLSQKSFYVFRKDRQCKFIFLLSPSLDLINIISVRALDAMKVAGKTLQRSRPTSPAAGSYLQTCIINRVVW